MTPLSPAFVRQYALGIHSPPTARHRYTEWLSPEGVRPSTASLNNVPPAPHGSAPTGPDYVDTARAFLQKRIELPTGYFVEWTGLYEYTTAAKARQRIVVPLTLVLIFGLLVIAFRSVSESVVIMLAVPFAMVGGVWVYLSVRRRRSDRHHYDHLYSRGNRQANSRAIL